MYEKRQKKWDKHIDFIILGDITIILSMYLGYMLRHGFRSTFIQGMPAIYLRMLVILIISDMCVGFLFESYKDIIRRGYLEELKRSVKHSITTDAIGLLCMFISKDASQYSRETMIVYYVLHCAILYILRCIRKHYVRKKMAGNPYKEHMLIITDDIHKHSCVNALKDDDYRNYKVVGVIVTNPKEIEEVFTKYEKELGNNLLNIRSEAGQNVYTDDAYAEVAATDEKIKEIVEGVEVVCQFGELKEYLLNNVVDSIFVNMSMPHSLRKRMINHITSSGVTIHINLLELPHELADRSVERIGKYTVLTVGMRIATRRQLFEKRIMDICGGLAGLVLMLIATLIFSPIIYIQSPGPIFFKQYRVGKNGRRFKMYKFRSMYMDAEERKEELMSQNKMDGLMFKMDDDPRIIPIGKFIRKYSIDELPQFLNVLKGDMSLVGTRPPTLDEYEQYQLHHMGRLSSKPGITGLWQVSGRSDMTDFERIVELDTKYISNWSLSEDIRILWRTITLVIKGDGAE